MKTTNDLNCFVEKCISTGRYVETGLNLPHSSILKIEDILSRYNDSTAKTKIRKEVRITKTH